MPNFTFRIGDRQLMVKDNPEKDKDPAHPHLLIIDNEVHRANFNVNLERKEDPHGKDRDS